MEDAINPPEGRLLKVYPREGAKDETSVDIVAIHGLGTTTPRTWEYKTKTRVINWLSDSNMLPDVVPSARIYTFSWNANYFRNAPVIRIANVADILLSNLKSYRDKNETHSRPLVFVASCFGGLVLTKALEIASVHESAYRKILVATTGVVFLGSPLQGTRAGNAAQWHAMISGILGRHPSQTLLEDLDGSRRALRETTHRFAIMIKTPPMQMMTTCFWETESSQVLKAVLPASLPKRILRTLNRTKMILVEEDSATIMGHEKRSLDAPHIRMNKFNGPNDANFGLVSNAIKEMATKAQEIARRQREGYHLHNEHFMVYRRPNPLFTGREGELRKLNQALCPSLLTSAHIAIPKIYVIHGMGGAGKSEIAVKFAHNNRFWGVFWIDGRSTSSITNGFAAIARQCGHQDESLEGVTMWLQNISHSWLLILDNADNQDLNLAHYLPAGRNGSILITTRLVESVKYETVGKDHYESLSQETAIDLLLKACGIEMIVRSDHANHARAVVELLGFHALAIIQAGAAISQNLCNLEEYRNIFMVQRKALLQYYPGQARSEYGGVYATFEVSAKYLEDRVDQTAKDALQLLDFYAFMHFSDFPEIAFEEAWKNSSDEDVVSTCLNADGEEDIDRLAPWHVSHLPSFIHKNTHDINLDKLRLRRARSLLGSLSLVNFDSAKGMTRMHPVSHFWSRDRLQDPEKSRKARLNGFCVLSLSIKDPYLVDVLPLARQLQSHIESLAHSLKDWNFPTCNFNVQQSIYRLSYIMFRLSCPLALFELLHMIPIKTDESWLRIENGDAIQMLHGMCEHRYGDANKAVNLLEKLNDTRMQTLSEEDPKVLDSQHELAKAYLQIEDRTKAVDLNERIVQSRRKILNPEDEILLYSQHELATAYLEIEDTTKAIALLEEVVKVWTKTLRPEHPNRLASQNELARAYLNIEETDKAITLLESVVEIRARTLNPEHRDRLTSQHALAYAYLEIGETNKAITLLESVMEIRARTLNPEHRDRLTSQHELARAYLEIGETDKAITLLESMLEIGARTLNPEHRDRLASQHELASAYLDMGETEKAITLLESVVEIQARTLNPEHRDRLTSQHELARAYMNIGETDKAITLQESVMEIRARTLKPEHRDLLTSQYTLASAYLNMRETKKAITLLETVVDIEARTLRADHPDRVTSIYLLALCHYHASNYERALELARSIEDVAQNRQGQEIADWNADLIGFLLEEIGLEEEEEEEKEETP